jgi:hypothetical protein
MKTTQETREVLHAIAVVAARYVQVSADGKVSLRDKLGFISCTPEIYDAIKGIREVPAELEDLDTNERVVLSGDVRQVLIAAGVSHRNSDIAEWILEWAYGMVRATVLLFNRIKDAPRSAVAV